MNFNQVAFLSNIRYLRYSLVGVLCLMTTSCAINMGTTEIDATSSQGGASSALRGGSFKEGFRNSFVMTGLTAAAVKMRQLMVDQSRTNPMNVSGKSVGFRRDGVKLGGGRALEYPTDEFGRTRIMYGNEASPLGGHQGGQGSIFGFEYGSGSLVDRVVESYAGPHDWLNSHYWYLPSGNVDATISGFSNFVGERLNEINVLVATPMVSASVVEPYWDSYHTNQYQERNF